MTGEISLRGRVMRIGGLREKTMAALRHGVRTVIIPKDNERDLEEIDQTVRRQLNFISAQDYGHRAFRRAEPACGGQPHHSDGASRGRAYQSEKARPAPVTEEIL